MEQIVKPIVYHFVKKKAIIIDTGGLRVGKFFMYVERGMKEKRRSGERRSSCSPARD